MPVTRSQTAAAAMSNAGVADADTITPVGEPDDSRSVSSHRPAVPRSKRQLYKSDHKDAYLQKNIALKTQLHRAVVREREQGQLLLRTQSINVALGDELRSSVDPCEKVELKARINQAVVRERALMGSLAVTQAENEELKAMTSRIQNDPETVKALKFVVHDAINARDEHRREIMSLKEELVELQESRRFHPSDYVVTQEDRDRYRRILDDRGGNYTAEEVFADLGIN